MEKGIVKKSHSIPLLLKGEGTKKDAGPILDEARAKAGITTDEVKYVALHGGIIEDYPDDKRGNSCE